MTGMEYRFVRHNETFDCLNRRRCVTEFLLELCCQRRSINVGTEKYELLLVVSAKLEGVILHNFPNRLLHKVATFFVACSKVNRINVSLSFPELEVHDVPSTAGFEVVLE